MSSGRSANAVEMMGAGACLAYRRVPLRATAPATSPNPAPEEPGLAGLGQP
jgi:hypothetical protein